MWLVSTFSLLSCFTRAARDQWHATSAGEHLIEVFLFASRLGAPRRDFPNHAGENDEPNLPSVTGVHHDFLCHWWGAGQAGTPAFRMPGGDPLVFWFRFYVPLEAQCSFGF